MGAELLTFWQFPVSSSLELSVAIAVSVGTPGGFHAESIIPDRLA